VAEFEFPRFHIGFTGGRKPGGSGIAEMLRIEEDACLWMLNS
jgi:hypothetical protein